jgi:hypothetical protein
MKCRDRSLLMGHEHVARALVELRQIRKTSAGTDRVLQHAPEAFDRIEVRPTPSWPEMPPKRLVPVGQRRRELMGPVDATAVSDHDHRFPRVAKESHHWMDLLTEPRRVKMRDNLIDNA